ncbi:MAG: hypothetical protein IJN03_01785 [Bacilli bacterium]|nr:hypothetical protein [Bacilli bacterium]
MGLKKFNYKIKENKKKPLIIAGLVVMFLLIGVTIYGTYAAYKVTNSYNILKGNIDFFEKRDLTIAVKLVEEDGTVNYVEEIPTEGYVFDLEKSYCVNGATINYVNGKAEIEGLNGKEKCTMYFNELGALAKAIIANSTIVETTPNFDTSAHEANTNLYKAEDDLGTSYYFRGGSTNNYVKFGFNSNNDSMYWRIIRINGDGTIRMIYDGTSPIANGVAHTASIASTAYNGDADDTKYVGYTYDVNGVETDSTIKGVVDDWYEANLKENYEKYIADGIFCNDREIQSYDYYDYNFDLIDNPALAVSVGINYGPTWRVEVKSPELKCTNKSDRYTTSEKKGNGLLNNPVGLLTADEIVFAGAIDGWETHYLYSGESYWTSSPSSCNDGTANAWLLRGTLISTSAAFESLGVRPVINLKGNVTFTGNGRIDTNSPYEIVIE